MRSFLMIFMLFIAAESFSSELIKGYPTDAEIAMLPKYCYVKLRVKPESNEYKSWQNRLGKDFMHTHHLCAARAFIIRANKMDEHRKYYFSVANNNLKYMEEHAKSDFVLMPDVYYYKAYILLKQEKYKDALTYVNKAISSNEDYLRPYLLKMDIYYQLKDVLNMEKALAKAKIKFPNSRSVKRREKKLKKLKKLKNSQQD